jgi:hypothetical protein
MSVFERMFQSTCGQCGRYYPKRVMTNADKLLAACLEDIRSDQLGPLLAIAQKKGLSLGEAVVEAMRLLLECMTPQEREEAIWVFRRDGIDLEELL